MAAQSSKRSINLIPKAGLETTQKGRLVKWLLGTFRNIVIIVELIVIVGFAARTFLDVRARSLDRQIQERQQIISDQQEFEKKFRATQDRLALFSKLSDETRMRVPVMERVAAFLPEDVAFESIRLEGGRAIIEVSSFSEGEILQFISNLRSNVSEEVEVLSVSGDSGVTSITYHIGINTQQK